MDARPHLIAIITVLFLLIALPSCQRQSVSPGGLPPGPPSGGGGSVGVTQPTSTPFVTTIQATIISASPTPRPGVTASAPSVPPSASTGGGASVQQTAVVSPTAQPAQPAQSTVVADIACNIKGVHVVAQGENLYRISLRYRMSMEGLARMNNIWDPNYLRIGQRLQTLSCYAVRSYGWWVWERGTYNPPPVIIDSGISGSSTYVVQQGDTLYRIAVRFNTTVRDLIIANGLANENVAAGQRLFVP